MQTASTPRSDLTRGYAVALISAGFLSTTAIFIRYLTQTYHIPALVLAFWRDVIVVLVLLPALAVLRPLLLRAARRQLFFLVVYGFVLAVFNALWTLSVALNGAAVSTVLAYTSAAFTALLGWWFLKERLDWAKILAVVVSLGGCVLVAGAWDPALWGLTIPGILIGVLSGLAYALYSLMGRSASQRGLNPWTSLLYIFAIAAVFLLIFNLLPGAAIPGTAAIPSDLLWLGGSFAGWGILFLLAAGPTLGGFGLYNVSLSYLPASVANLILTSEPAFTVTVAYVLLNERLSAVQIVGSAMILAAVIFLRIHEGRRARRIRPK